MMVVLVMVAFAMVMSAIEVKVVVIVWDVGCSEDRIDCI